MIYKQNHFVMGARYMNIGFDGALYKKFTPKS